ncbi:hypothetical protein L1080_035620 [Rhodococcus sp. MSC1_016]|jgi:bifunctional non-homologous end joining protein LigD|uniref:hypothetical protein n=1 Tax=Rhodococcus sp. MSC1_016 TaxID=2909266 RepID=UPI002030E29E|nr:hypothetical protein [Rhodococcus sp. MSC1_016]
MGHADRGLFAPLFAPILATLAAPPEGEFSGSWAAEIKYDGCRLLASAGGRSDPVLGSRNLNVVTSSNPELVEALADAFGAAAGWCWTGRLWRWGPMGGPRSAVCDAA